MARLILAALLLSSSPSLAAVVGWIPAGEPLPEGVTAYSGAQGTILVAPTDLRLPPSVTILPTSGDAYLAPSAAVPAGSPGVVHRDDTWTVLAPTDPRDPAFAEIHPVQVLRVLPRGSGPRAPVARAKAVDPAVKAEVVAAVDGARFTTLVRELSGDVATTVDGAPATLDARYTHRADHQLAADWIQEHFEAMGYPTVQQEFSVQSSGTQNVIATKTGTVTPDEIVLLGAHYDSICFGCMPLSDPTPGAEDNASGVAAVLMAAEILTAYDTERTVVFVAFGGEEQGLFGSSHYASELGAGVDDVVAAVTMDMISYRSGLYSIDVEGFNGTENGGAAADSRDLMDLVLANAGNSVSPLATDTLIPGFGSDHVPLAYAGIPTVLVIESEYASYPHYHRSTDVFTHLDPAFGTDVVRVVMATLADLAGPLAATGTRATSFGRVKAGFGSEH